LRRIRSDTQTGAKPSIAALRRANGVEFRSLSAPQADSRLRFAGAPNARITVRLYDSRYGRRCARAGRSNRLRPGI